MPRIDQCPDASRFQLNAVQRQIKTIQPNSEAERNRRNTELNASRFIGRIEAGITQYDRLRSNDDLKRKLDELTEKVKALRTTQHHPHAYLHRTGPPVSRLKVGLKWRNSHPIAAARSMDARICLGTAC